MNAKTPDHVIDVKNLTRRFRRKLALNDVSLEVPPGCVFGLVGENGAGKTTLINHLLGSYIPQKGTVRVLGMDPTQHPVQTLSRIGVLTEDRIMPTWMTVRELVKFTSTFYPNWDPTFAQELLELFKLDPECSPSVGFFDLSRLRFEYRTSRRRSCTLGIRDVAEVEIK